MQAPVYYVGTPKEVAHHAAPLAGAFDLRIVSHEEVVRVARAGEVCVFFNEYFPRFRDACLELGARGCPTLYAIDGILEWRNSWEPPRDGSCCPWVMRPVLSHKVACIGRSQARVLESWGNLGKCEVVGVPRFDSLSRRPPRTPAPEQPFRVLVLTAKCPGFNPHQVACAAYSLLELKHWFEQNPRLNDRSVQPVWRITQGLEKMIGVENQLHDTTGKDLASVLPTIDAVITTPSTAMLEGMLHGLPVALLDYHNRPHYVPAAWRITSGEQLDEILPELLSPLPERMLYQDSILHDALECHTAATPRLVELIEQMHEVAQQCLQGGRPLSFPRRILRDAQDGHHLPESGYGHERLFPAENADAAKSASEDGSPRSLDNPPRRKWSGLTGQIELQGTNSHNRTAAKLQRELWEARRELEQWQRRTIAARLTRLRNKILRLLRRNKPPAAQADDQLRRAA